MLALLSNNDVIEDRNPETVIPVEEEALNGLMKRGLVKSRAAINPPAALEMHETIATDSPYRVVSVVSDLLDIVRREAILSGLVRKVAVLQQADAAEAVTDQERATAF